MMFWCNVTFVLFFLEDRTSIAETKYHTLLLITSYSTTSTTKPIS